MFEYSDYFVIGSILYLATYTNNDALAEWLRRVPAKYMGFPRESSNLSGVVYFLDFFSFCKIYIFPFPLVSSLLHFSNFIRFLHFPNFNRFLHFPKIYN